MNKSGVLMYLWIGFCILCTIGLTGFGIWAIIKLMQFFGVI